MKSWRNRAATALAMVGALVIAACSHAMKVGSAAKDAATTTPDLGHLGDAPEDGNVADKNANTGVGKDADSAPPDIRSDDPSPDAPLLKNDTSPDGSDARNADAGTNGSDVPRDSARRAEDGGCKTLLLGGTLPLDPTWGDPVALADLNGDRKLDLVTTTSLLFGTGDGRFSPGLDDTTASAVGDLNGDGVVDLVLTNGGSATVSVSLGRGDGTFTAKRDYDVGARYLPPDAGGSLDEATTMALGDVNGDGKLDLVAANHGSSAVTVLFGKGDGTFGSGRAFPTGEGPVALTLGDLNGDGKTDLVTVSLDTATMSVLLGTGGGAFAASRDYPLPIDTPTGWDAYQTTLIALDDLNRDGKLDLVLVTFWMNQASVLLGKGDGTFAASVDYPLGDNSGLSRNGPTAFVLADLNGDGKQDLVVANTMGPTLAVLLGKGDGGFAARQEYPAVSASSSLAVGDLNGDGKPDIAASGGVVLFGNGDGTFATGPKLASGSFPEAVLGDVNGDGKLDLVTAGSSVLLGKGDGSFAAGVDYPTGGARAVALGDLNGDGKLDIATANGAAATVSVLLGKGDGTFAANVDLATGPQPGALALGDLNGDGKLDIVTAGTGQFGQNGTVTVLLGTGNGAFAARVDLRAGQNTAAVAIGDMNRDGKPDLVLANSGSDASYSVDVWLGNGDGTFTTVARDFSVDGSNVVALGDLNGDGNLDIVASGMYQSPNQVSVLLGKGDGTLTSSADYGTTASPHPIALGDLNGDGNLDIVVGNWGLVSVLFGMGDGTFAPKTDYLAARGQLMLGDVNGDGRLDIVQPVDSNTVSVLLGSCR